MESQQGLRSSKESLHVPFKEKLKSIPGVLGIRLTEEPYYAIMKSEGDFEIRKYDPITFASIMISGPYLEAIEEGFLRLANYIFGKNSAEHEARMPLSVSTEGKHHEEIPMTAPVFYEHGEEGWTISFALPREYNLKNAPRPEDPAIYLHRESPRIVAVLRYSGSNSLSKIESKEIELRRWLQSHMDFRAVSNARCAEYDGPMTVPFFRRNEAMIRVDRIYA